MNMTTMTSYCQTVAMTELMLKDLHTWVYRQYGRYVMMLQICVIMLHWGTARPEMSCEAHLVPC